MTTLLADPARGLLRAAPINPFGHTMGGDRLLRYLEIKVHHLIQDQGWDSIRVLGGYDRTAVISRHEKSGKLFNIERPTAEAHGRDLVVKAFPGADYVQHYALIIATYLAMTGRPADIVTYQPPGQEECRTALKTLDLELDGDLVIVGWGLQCLAPKDGVWTYGHGYAWQRAEVAGRRVVYLGFLHSIWGDVAGRVVTRLAELGVGDVVYVGKVGSLTPGIEPNTWLATGNTSLLGGALVSWDDFFGDFAATQGGVRSGLHVSSPSILLEDRDWLARHATSYAFVDPEIGRMGVAACQAGIRFGYLHVISNNLATQYAADLSNERQGDVLHRRAVLVDRIHAIITGRLTGSAAHTLGGIR
ncbi:hypothetical protein Aph01nite_29330 [Acrocarpospora phusangensis]|uniref:Nucleoside phosphorylase domain-containing protein n=1 Tax=Acrocarpospora phusangensis TaxID=1070424 RepID=A0A919Q9Q3_9ACTN|nr:hypothetical protein [Acrocarpospora phusangensis]GIH24623.1 hypothetical protein Aph01nite_29330 [Acrocarpospora phusangensis]